MDTAYQPIYKQAAALQHKFHDYTHASAHDPAANLLRNEIHALTTDLASGKNPRTIENRIKMIDRQLQQVQRPISHAMPGQGPVMNTNQSTMLRKNFETMRMNIRQQPRY